MADITGTAGNDTLIGTDQPDRIEGLAGNDVLDGRGAADQLLGGEGDDTFYVDDAGDTVTEAANQGNDTVYALTSYALSAGSHVETLSAYSIAWTSALNLTGNELSNILVGTYGANVLYGGAGGADVLIGFRGDDTYIVDGDDVVYEDEAIGGNDIVYALGNYTLGAGQRIETLSSFSIANQGDLNLTGNEFSNVLAGTYGANTLYGGAGGQDVLIGFRGDDTYIVDADDVVYDDEAIGGYDIVYALANYTLVAGQYIEVLSSFSIANQGDLNLTGNEFGNLLAGTYGANTLHGGAGGADVLIGFRGDDTYYVDGDDAVYDDEAIGGTDIVYALANYTLGAGQHIEVLSSYSIANQGDLNLTGNEFGNVIAGTYGVNVLHGGSGGADVLIGFRGDDTYYVDADDVVYDDEAIGGTDIVYALGNYTLGAGQYIEVLSSFSIANQGDLNLTGNEFSNTLAGTNAVNVLDGKGGNDYLVAFAGADIFAFTTALNAATNVDTIAEFQVGIDKIQLGGDAGQPFAALASGTLGTGSFLSGSPDPYAGASVPDPGSSQIRAMDGNDYILYNSATGALLYDADGNGAGTAVRFATLAPGLSLTAADFVVSGPANNPPAITSGGAASIDENSPANSIVYQIVATDADNDRITYSLTGADAGLLTIDALTGTVRLIGSPDFETKPLYSFNVVASDSGTSTVKAVALTINNLPDASTPIVNETAAANDSIGTAQTIDRGVLAVASNPNLPDDDLPSATIVGNLPNSSDKDFFSIMLQAGEKLILDVDNSGGNLDAHVRVYDASGQQIGANDDPGFVDPGSDPHPTYGHNTDSQFSFRAPTAGIYYFSIESFQDPQNQTLGSYEINVSVGPPATAAELLAELIAADIQALIHGTKWPTNDITYSFPNAGSDYPPNPGESVFGDGEPATFAPFSGSQPGAVQGMLQHISNVTLLTFQQLFDPNDGNAQLRYAMTDETEAAHAYLPGNSNEAGSAWFNKLNFDNPIQGNYSWMGMLHETGHTLGLKHGHEDPALSADRDSLEYSVMTYRSFPGQDLSGPSGYTNGPSDYPQSLMMYDIAALQKIYGGANYTYNSGDSVYTWNSVSGQMLINGSPATFPVGPRIFLTVWDGDGNDTYDLSSFPTFGATIDLRPGEWTTISTGFLANLGMAHTARGNVANALLFEGDTRSLIENAIGSASGDTIIANQVANRLTGGGGTDLFTWKASTDAGVAAAADTITDFLRNTDRIDLSNIDANPGTGANDAFTFIDTQAFHNVAGELRYQVEGANLRVQADLDGNGVADMEFIVNNNTIFAATDFFL